MRQCWLLLVCLALVSMSGCGTLSPRPASADLPAYETAPAALPVAATDAPLPAPGASPGINPNEGMPALPPDEAEEENNDPFEPFNRKVYAFNSALDRAVLKPVAKAYDKVTPQFVRTGVGNFFRNLLEPTNIINHLLQGKVLPAIQDTARFVWNSTAGIGGLFDIATPMGMPRSNEDFGQTLGVWGFGPGPYLVLPFFGPRDVRDTFGFVVDWNTDPLYYFDPWQARYVLRAVDYVDLRAQLLGASSVLEQATDDEYLFVREAYLQRRRSLVYDGNVPFVAPPP